MTAQESAIGHDEANANRDLAKNNLIVQPNRVELVQAAAGMIAAASLISIDQRGAFNIALAGGSTPGPVYELLGCRRRDRLESVQHFLERRTLCTARPCGKQLPPGPRGTS